MCVCVCVCVCVCFSLYISTCDSLLISHSTRKYIYAYKDNSFQKCWSWDVFLVQCLSSGPPYK